MKILLIYPDIASFHGLPYHPGLASIASVLRSERHEVRVSYFDEVSKTKDILRLVREWRPEMVGFTAVETQFRHAVTLADRIKEILNPVIVFGGPFATLAPEVILSHDSIDAVIVGEGEKAIVEFAGRVENGGDWSGISNIVYRDSAGAKVVRNRLNPLIDDLDSLPQPAIDLFPYQEIIDRDNIAMFYFNRGCPYLCTFCSNAALSRVYDMPSNRMRMRSVDSAMNEIHSTLGRYKLRDDTMLLFGDDLFIHDKRWLSDFCGRYKKEINRPFWCTGRSNLMTDEICRSLKDAGCAMLMMSVESGNDYIRNEVMKRNISRQTLFASFDLCHHYGINTLATCIIGLPYETPAMIEDSIKTIAQLKSITSYGINIFYPYKGTALRELCERDGYLPEKVRGDFVERKESALILPLLSRAKLNYYYKNWINLVMRHKGFSERTKYMLRQWWSSFRKTTAGNCFRSFVNDTAVGKRVKKMVLRKVWNRA